jgi:hypothetical protein
MSNQRLIGHPNSPKIDDHEVNGLLGVTDSLAYKTHEIERHLHSYERAFEIATVPNGEIHVADRIGDGSGAFQVDAGNDDWGAWIQVLGSSDTPVIAGGKFFNFHRMSVVDVERSLSVHFIQMGFGETGAEALASNETTELPPYKPQSVNAEPYPLVIQSRRIAAGTKVWIRIKIPGQATGTLDFYPAIHEYEG